MADALLDGLGISSGAPVPTASAGAHPAVSVPTSGDPLLAGLGVQVEHTANQPTVTEQLPNKMKIAADTATNWSPFASLEGALNVASGMVAKPVSDIFGLAATAHDAITGNKDGDAQGFKNSIQNALTYQPRTDVGKAVAQYNPLSLVGQGLQYVGDHAANAVKSINPNSAWLDAAGNAVGEAVPQAAGIFGGNLASKAIQSVLPAAKLNIPNQPDAVLNPSVNYDVPAIIRNGARPVAVQPAIPTPEVPPSSGAVPASALDKFIKDQSASPYGQVPPPDSLQVPGTPDAPLESPLDALLKSKTDSINTIRLGNTEAPQNAVTNRYDAQGNRIIPESPVPEAPELPPANAAAEIPEPQKAISNPTNGASALDSFAKDAKGSPLEPLPDLSPAPKAEQTEQPALNNPQSGVVQPEQPLSDRTPITSSSTSTIGPAEQARRAQILSDAGITNADSSAINADAAHAAQLVQISKITSHPAGRAAFDYFNGIKDSMENNLSNIIPGMSKKESFGLDQTSLLNKGRDIAAPNDALHDYFDKAEQKLYDTADTRAKGLPIKSTSNIDALLDNRSFNNSALADDNLNLVKGIKQELEVHKARNADGMTVKDAEDFRKFLNKRWTPQNRDTIRLVKDALDKDVFSSAGEDVYNQSRALHQAKIATLENPKGMSALFDYDPYTKINRNTAYENIPTKIMNLPVEQFRHIVDTYRNLPPEMAGIGEKAINTLKAHYGDILAKQGLETRGGNSRPTWNDAGIRELLNENSAHLQTLFNKPGELEKLQNFRDAGNILSANPAYPGAAAQAHLALENGLFAKYIGKIGAATGAGAGSFLAGPVGGFTGHVAGDVLGSSIGKKMGEGAAVKRVQDSIISTDKAAQNGIISGAKGTASKSSQKPPSKGIISSAKKSGK